jgi:hypothetical protein
MKKGLYLEDKWEWNLEYTKWKTSLHQFEHRNMQACVEWNLWYGVYDCASLLIIGIQVWA